MCRAAYASCISSCKSALHAETMPLPRVDVSAVATSDGSLEFTTELSGGSRFLGGEGQKLAGKGCHVDRVVEGISAARGGTGRHVAVRHVRLQWSNGKDVQEAAGMGWMADPRVCRQKVSDASGACGLFISSTDESSQARAQLFE